MQSGRTIQLEKPLVYGDKDAAITGDLRTALEAQEEKRLKAKVEYGACYDDDGNLVGSEAKGGRGSVRIYSQLSPSATTMTHNHPRGKNEEDNLGGTFSEADCRGFARFPQQRTMRASAAEGTYSMTKGPNFNGTGFLSFVRSAEAKATKAHADREKALRSDLSTGKISFATYLSSHDSSFNTFLIDMHNAYLEGQSTYGYTYTLERR